MNLEEFIDEFGRKKKARRLVDIDVEEITLCGSAANRKSFYIKKRNKMSEIFELVEEFLETQIGKSAVGEVKLEQALKAILGQKADFPDNLKEALDVILKSMAQQYGHTAKGQADSYPSIPIVGPAHLLSRMIPDADDDDDTEISEWDE